MKTIILSILLLLSINVHALCSIKGDNIATSIRTEQERSKGAQDAYFVSPDGTNQITCAIFVSKTNSSVTCLPQSIMNSVLEDYTD